VFISGHQILMQVFSFAQLTLCKIKPFVTENDEEMYMNRKETFLHIDKVKFGKEKIFHKQIIDALICIQELLFIL